MGGIAQAGSWDLVAGLVLCAPARAREVWVEGRAVVREGRIAMADWDRVAARQKALTRKLVGG